MRKIILLFFIILLSGTSIGKTDFHILTDEDNQKIIHTITNFLTKEYSDVFDVKVSTLHGTLVPSCESYKASVYSKSKNRITMHITCEENLDWSIYLQALISRLESIVVSSQKLDKGISLSPLDLRVEKRSDYEGDNFFSNIADVSGLKLLKSCPPGYVLTTNDVMQPLVIQMNQPVIVSATGETFVVHNKGIALNQAFPGQTVKVKLSNQRIIEGIAMRKSGEVSVSF